MANEEAQASGADEPLIGEAEELRNFEKRHPTFRAAAARLEKALETSLLRTMTPKPDKPAPVQLVISFLGHQAAEDFFDIVLLAVHGQGGGALKLLRPLFERVVTAVYLMKHPEDVQDFNDYADVHARKVINHARENGVDLTEWVTAERVAEVEAAYQRVKERFKDQQSWTKKNLKVLADEIGLGSLYAGAAFWPTMLLHTTRVGLEARLDTSGGSLAFHHGPRREDADRALGYAHALIVQLLYACNQFFEWGLDVKPLLDDAAACWDNVEAG